MARAERNLKVVLTLNESEAIDIYRYLSEDHHPNNCREIKEEIVKALGYTPVDDEL